MIWVFQRDIKGCRKEHETEIMIFYEPTAAFFFFCGYEKVGWVGTVFPMRLRLVWRRRSEGLWECCV